MIYKKCKRNIHLLDSNGQIVKEEDTIYCRCPNCNRIVPNRAFLHNKGCKWCTP